MDPAETAVEPTGTSPAPDDRPAPEPAPGRPGTAATQAAIPAAAPAPARAPWWRRAMMDIRPLRHAPYRRLVGATAVTTVGSQLTAVAVPKQIYDITGSSAWVGYASLAGLVPMVVFALWGGAVADVVDRRTMMLLTNTGIALTSIALWLQAFGHVHSVWLLMGLLAVQQALFGMNSPASNASVARLVPLAELPAANALDTTVMQTGQIFGPLLAGVLIPVIGLPELYLADTVALCATLWAVWRMPPLPPLTAPTAERRRAGWRQVGEGFRYITARRVLLVSFLADIIAMVFGMPRALFPQLAATTYAPWGSGFALGLLFAAIPIGGMAGGLLSGTFSRARRHGAMVIGAVAAWGLAIMGFGLSGGLWWAAVFLALAGVADMVSMVFRGAILQSVATDDMRGRMQGVFTVVVAGGPRLADLLHGTMGQALSPRVAVAAGGVLTVVAVLAMAAAVPDFLRYRASDA